MREHQRARHEVLRRCARVVGGVERPLGDGDVPGGGDERRELFVRDGRRADRERVDMHVVRRRLLRVVVVGAHAERARRDRIIASGSSVRDHRLATPACSLASTFSMLKLAGSCRGGNSTSVVSMLRDVHLCRHQHPGPVHHPVVVGVRRDVGPFVRVGAQVEDLRDAQLGERLGPDLQGARARVARGRRSSSCRTASR